jgi:hypothetical protein
MTREQINRIRGRGYGTQSDLKRLLAAAERALELEDVLTAAKALRTSHDLLQMGGWPVGSPAHRKWVKRDNDLYWKLLEAIDRAEGKP